MQNVDQYYPASGRVILHVDMNAFYCSVHEAEDPEQYKGKATAVAGSVESRRGLSSLAPTPHAGWASQPGCRCRRRCESVHP